MNTNILKTAIAALALLVVFNSCEKETKFHIEVACNPEHGTVTGTGDYAEGSKATIIATPNEGYCFVKWEGHTSTDSILIVNVSADKTYTAIFGKADIIQKFPNGYMKTSETIEGYTITYEAVPDENCYFLKWSNGEINPVIKTQEAITDLTPIFRQYPEGSIHALFSVGNGKRVIFSKGNLQFNPSLGTHTRADGTTAPGTWRFAETQTERITDDSIVNATYNGWIDDFAWGTSGWSGSGATYYQPYDGRFYENLITDEDSIASLFGPQGECILTGEYAFADWGVYNPISNGGNKPGMWRTINEDEFKYFINNSDYQDCICYGYPYCYSFYAGNENSQIKHTMDFVELKKIIDADNRTVFFYYDDEHWSESWGIWTANGGDESDAVIVDARNSLKGWAYVFPRHSRQNVRLVMDVEE
ncbi:MAG: hypothetical protein J6U04_09085 [Salinivirgaceae bacterium]|nr:hypothetical protein [Salinivirgaceae bacterium]